MLLAGPLAAQEPLDEDALFGGDGTRSERGDVGPSDGSSSGAESPPPSAAAISSTGGADADLSRMDPRLAPITQLSSSAAPLDPLRIGGQVYSRLLATQDDLTPPARMTLSAPTLVDLYLDARPNDRLRGYVSGRLQHNPLGSSSTLGIFAPTPTAEEQTTVLLNQLWVRFDLGRRVFVTAGKQHVKWGTGRFWNPSDLLQPVRRNPLEPFDVRTGVPLIKLHVPWEATGWNFYAVAVLDSLRPIPQLDRTGGAFRAELVLGTAELGLDALFRRYHTPRYGLDLSAALGPLDIYGELGLQNGSTQRIWTQVSETYEADASEMYEYHYPDGLVWGATGGLSTSHIFNDNDNLTLGLEFHHNAIGYEDADLYPWLLLQGDYTPFYLGRNYLAAFALLTGPGNLNDTSFTFSTLANLADFSFISRLDLSTLVLTHLSLEAFAAIHTGTRGGEFRLGFDTDPLVVEGQSIPALSVGAPLLDLGLSLRFAI